MKGKKVTKSELLQGGWEEKGPFGEGLLFQKDITQIVWDPESGIVKLQRDKP